MSEPYYVPTTTGPLAIEFLGHESIESFDTEAGEPGAALFYANLYHIHRDTIEIFAEAFTPFLEKISGIPRGIDEEMTKKAKARAVNPDKVTPILVRFVPYLNKVCAKVSEKELEVIKLEALRISRSIKINVAPAERKSPIEVMYYTRADSILEADLDTINGKVSKFLSLVPDFQLVRDSFDKPLRESLARLLQKFDAARWAQED